MFIYKAHRTKLIYALYKNINVNINVLTISLRSFKITSLHVSSVFLLAADPCNPNPCKNDGTCVENKDKTGRYQCTCAEGFGGDTCAIGKIWFYY